MTSLCLFATLLCISAVSCAPVEQTLADRGDLIFSHVLYRHGDRTPTSAYPTDPYDISVWPRPWGSLTVRGIQMHFALGKWLRQRYGNILLSDRYTPNEIYVRSTDVPRTLQSAQSNLAGLYPPQGNQIWNSDLPWQPIPVHTVPAADDWLMGSSVPSCPVYEAAYQELKSTRGFLDSFNNTDTIFQYIAQNSGQKIAATLAGLSSVNHVRDTIFIEDQYNLTLPAWTKEIFPNTEVDELCQMSFYIAAYTPLLAKIRSGFLIKDILDRSDAKYNGTLSPNINVIVYSAHDNILATLMYSLGIETNDLVQYAACLVFELRSTSAGPNIEVFYKKDSDTNVATALYIPNCGYSCPVASFRTLYADIIPTQDFDTLCQTQL